MGNQNTYQRVANSYASNKIIDRMPNYHQQQQIRKIIDTTGIPDYIIALPDPQSKYMCTLYQEDCNLSILHKYTIHLSKYPQLISIIRILIEECGLDVNAQTNLGFTPLMIAAAYNLPECVKLLLEYGANVNLSNYIGLTALFYAVKSHCYDAARLIVEAGVDVNYVYKNNWHWTALHLAARTGDEAIVKLLLDHGANIDILTYKAESATALAAIYNHYKCIELIESSRVGK